MRFPPYADLDKDQRNVYADAPVDGAILVTGPPGTGKTVIAMHRAIRLASDDRPVAIIMFGKVLSRYTGNFEGLPSNVQVVNAHNWFPGWYKTAFDEPIPKIGKFEFNWSAVRAAINKCQDVSILRRLSWGHLVIDEGQDFSSGMYKALMALVRHQLLPKKERPTLTVFADENQTIFDDNSTIVELIEELNATVQSKRLWRLDKNYRNSFEIANFSRHFQVRGASSVKLPDRQTSQLPSVFVHLNVDSPYDQIARFATNFGALEVGVIVFGYKSDIKRAYENINRRVETLGLDCRVQAYVSGMRNSPLSDTRNLQFDSPPSITVVHSQSAKGLEFDAVFLLNINALNPRDDGELDSFKRLYVAGSRARDHLFLLITGSLQENFVPDSLRLLPDPTSGLCNFYHTESEEADLESLLGLVDWCDSAYQYQRIKLKSEGFMNKIRNIERKILVSELESLAIRSFYRQAAATIIEERVDSDEDLLDLIIELDPIQVKSALSLE